MQVEEPVLRIMERTTDVGAVVVVVQGEIDISTVDALRARLADSCRGDVTVDLRRVEFLDCLGLQLLLEPARRTAPRTAGASTSSRARRPCGGVFELTGTLERLSFVEPAPGRFARV